MQDTMSTLRSTFAAEIQQVDRALASYLGKFAQPPSHYEMIRYHLGLQPNGDGEAESSLHARGKRLRAIVCLLIGRSMGAKGDVLTTLMLASELLHNASLVHDDIQDSEPMRWGRPTAWMKFGIDQAINVGDAMVGMAFDLLLKLRHQGVSSAVAIETTDRYVNAYLRMAEGQHSDMVGARADMTRTEYLDMIERKTAAPLECFAAATALVAGSAPEMERSFGQFGLGFGMLYQVCDDIRAIWGDPLETGKKSRRDIELRKPSLPLVIGMERASSRLKALIAAPKGSPLLTEAEVGEVTSELANAEVFSACREIADRYRDETLEHLYSALRGHPDGTTLKTLEMMVRLCAATAVPGEK
ncbi:polyprenyl synthetase family protein [Pendulispora albinea]|uniref:Polyprenyl synthetase family protein n=1 Tax=Pendulispora albinea TaxID=2741071 RepID=A0ABZ2MCI9_9BACT